MLTKNIYLEMLLEPKVIHVLNSNESFYFPDDSEF